MCFNVHFGVKCSMYGTQIDVGQQRDYMFIQIKGHKQSYWCFSPKNMVSEAVSLFWQFGGDFINKSKFCSARVQCNYAWPTHHVCLD